MAGGKPKFDPNRPFCGTWQGGPEGVRLVEARQDGFLFRKRGFKPDKEDATLRVYPLQEDVNPSQSPPVFTEAAPAAAAEEDDMPLAPETSVELDEELERGLGELTRDEE
jgi:hypothetical protein